MDNKDTYIKATDFILTHQLLLASSVIVTCCLALFAINAVMKQRADVAYMIISSLIAIYVLFSAGQDLHHHILRVATIVDQLRTGSLNLLVENKTTGEVVPVFLYYSVIPYIVPVCLVFLGLSTHEALQITLLIEFTVFCLSVYVLIGRLTPEENKQTALCAGILLITANYVFSIWVVRAALAEIWAYSLIPLAILYALNKDGFYKLIFILFLQICSHPIVFLYSVLGVALTTYINSERSLMETAGGVLAACLASLALAAPFWAPQMIFMNDVLGVRGIPTPFADSFQPAWMLLNPLSFTTFGPALIVASVLAFVLAVKTRQLKAVAGMAALYILLVLQTSGFSDLISKVPVLAQTQFVWRMMFPAAILAFGSILGFVATAGAAHYRSFSILATVAVVLLVPQLLVSIPKSVVRIANIPNTSQSGLDAYYVNFGSDPRSVWGVRLFSPNYGRLEQFCPLMTKDHYRVVSFSMLNQPIRMDATYVGIPAGPFGFVNYTVDGVRVTPRFCDRTLIVGPLNEGAIVSVDRSGLDWVLYARQAALIVCSGAAFFMYLMERVRVRFISHG